MTDPKAPLTFLPVQLSRNRILHTIDALDPVTHPDRTLLRYLLTLQVPEFPQASTFVSIPTLEGREKPPVTQAGATTYEGAFFELESILDGFLSLQKPTPGQAVLSAIATLTMPYKLTEQVLPGGSAIDRDVKWLLKAGLTEEDANGWSGRFLDHYQAGARAFLTWQPDVKTVGIAQEEYLYFLLNCSPMPMEIRLRVEVTRADGTISETTLLTLKNAIQYQVVCAPVGPALLESYQLASNPIINYRVWLSNELNERLSQVRTYFIDSRYRRNERQILFSNSLGGFDTLRLVGAGSETLKVQRTAAEREKPMDADDFSELYIVDVAGKRSLTVSTGFFERNSRKTLRYLDELLLSREWYLISEKGHIPLELLTTDLVDHQDDDDLVARQFIFRHVSTQINYSEMPPAPLEAVRPTGWRGIGVMHILDAYGKRTGLGRPIQLQKYYLDDNSLYKPLTQKPNSPGAPDYIEALPLAGITPGSTPFPSVGISRPTTYNRSNCPTGQVGGPAAVIIAAGKYGGEAAGDADRLAEAEYASLNTQAYADASGSCTVSPEIYAWAVPAGKWHYRAGQPTKLSVHHTDGAMMPNMGNSYNIPPGANTYPQNSNDIDLPVINDSAWFLFTFGTPNQLHRIRVYRNGGIIKDTTFWMNSDGYELHFLYESTTLTSGDKLYLDLKSSDMLQLRVNGESADLAPNGRVDLELINPYLTYETLFTSSARLPSLPFSARNRRLFGYQDLLQMPSVQERRVVQQYYNGHLIQEGIGLTTVDSSGFQLSVVQPLGEFFGDFQTIPLSEIDFGTIAVPGVLPPVLVVAGQDAVCFPTILNPDYYGTNGGSIGYSGQVNGYHVGGYTAGPKVPMVFLKWLLQRIAAQTGTTISGTLLDHPQLSKLVLYNTRALDGAAVVTVRNHLPAWTIPQLLIELRKLLNLAYDFEAVQGRLSISQTDAIFKASSVKDWSAKAVKQYKRRAEVNRRLQLAFELDSGDALLKDKPDVLADYVTPQGDENTGIARLPTKLSTLLYDASAGLAAAKQPGVTAEFNQLTQTWSPRLLFWNGLEDDVPLALPTLDALSLYWLGENGLAATFWKETEAFRTKMFYVERELLLNETDLATLDFKQKVHINGVNYLVGQVAVNLPIRKPSQCMLVRV